MRKMVINDPTQDRFILVKVRANDLSQMVDEPLVSDYLHAQFKDDFYYLSLFKFNEGVFYFLWKQENVQWRIYHADMFCI